MGASIIAGVDASPVLETTKHVFDLVPLPIEVLVVIDLYSAVGSRWDAGGYAARCQGFAEPVGVVTPVAQQHFRFWQRVDHQSRAFVVAHLPFAEQHHQGAALFVADCMKLGVQTAFSAPDTSGNSPFFSRLAAVRCALRWVASIINRCGRGPLLASSAKILLNTPSRLQRTKRL